MLIERDLRRLPFVGYIYENFFAIYVVIHNFKYSLPKWFLVEIITLIIYLILIRLIYTKDPIDPKNDRITRLNLERKIVNFWKNKCFNNDK